MMRRGPTRRRVLVATNNLHCPRAALEHARALAGAEGEVVLATVMVIPVTQPLGAALERGVRQACDVLDEAERALEGSRADFDTRLVRARSFAKGVLDTLAAEPFDVLVLEQERDQVRNGLRAQIDLLLEKSPLTVVIVRPA
jgi:nucleotide-binding universal stress UspA family protein